MNYENLYLLNGKIAAEKESLAKLLRKEYIWIFVFMDALFVLFFLFNIGAMMLTNMSVVKTVQEQGGEVVLQEVNPVMAKVHGWELHPDYMNIMWTVIKQALIYAFFIISYCLARFKLYKSELLYMMLGVIAYYALISATDFFNDLSLFIPKMLGGC
jgi:hypothetical protein